MQDNKSSVGRDAILALAQSLAASKRCILCNVNKTDGTPGEHGAEKDAAAAQYSRAIHLLHSNLTRDECKDDLNNLAAIVIFYYYEVSQTAFCSCTPLIEIQMTSATHMDGWSFHAAGMAHLVESRGPQSFQSGHAKS